jgi:hypothetical protein
MKSKNDWVSRSWIGLSRRSAAGKPPLIGATQEQLCVPEHATAKAMAKIGRV